jgi:hypothetical protein
MYDPSKSLTSSHARLYLISFSAIKAEHLRRNRILIP